MVPYLKGKNLTIYEWRGNRDDDGWKATTSYSQKKIKPKHMLVREAHEYSNTFKPFTRLKHDMEELKKITLPVKSPIILVSTKSIYIFRYGFGNASRGGFGTSIGGPNELWVIIGTCNKKG